MKRLALLMLVALPCLLLAEPPEKPKVIKGPVVGKPVKPSVSPPLSEILRRQREKKAAEDAKASPERKVLNEHLAKYRAARGGQTMAIDTKELKELFPKSAFFVLRFRQYPVAIAPPEPLASNNIFVVSGKKVTHLKSDDALAKLFQAKFKKAPKPTVAKSIASAYLRLAQELHQDGFYQFQKPQFKVVDRKGVLTLNADVKVDEKRGDRGSLTLSISINAIDSTAKFKHDGKLMPGIRPRCQASRLLHADPVIREIMRRDLSVMGSVARHYLAEQWEKAGTELRKEIESVWQQILTEGR